MNKQDKYDVIVLGLGAMGSASAYSLSDAGLKVLGIDQFCPPHSQGSSSGHTRIFRQAYFEDPRYIPLLKRSFELWQDLATKSSTTHLHQIGFLLMGEHNNPMHQKIRQNGQTFDIKTEAISAANLNLRFPQFVLPRHFEGTFEPGAGFVDPEKAIKTFLNLACKNGAKLSTNEQVISWTSSTDLVEVRTQNNLYKAKKLVVALGPYVNRFANKIPEDFFVRRVPQFWFNGDDRYLVKNHMPTFAFALDNSFVFGFPNLENRGLKLANHLNSIPIVDPSQTDPDYSESEIMPVQKVIGDYLPGVDPRCIKHNICFYTLTSDENFLIDTDRKFTNIFYALGGSGHSFKFAPAIGEVMKNLVIGQNHGFELDFLKFRNV